MSVGYPLEIEGSKIYWYRLTAYPPVGMITVSFRGGFFKLSPGTFPFSQVGSVHLALKKKKT